MNRLARLTCALLSLLVLTLPRAAQASDHLDTPTVIADPAADIGDLYTWMAPDGKHLNLVLTVVGARFSDQVQYVFHIDSGHEAGKTTVSSLLLCEFDTAGVANCWLDDRDHLQGRVDDPRGVVSERARFKLFAGVRDDPFYNNVRGTRAAYVVAGAAFIHGVSRDESGCPHFDASTAASILDEWRHTEGHAGTNLLAGWKTGALVASVDLGAVNRGGRLLGVWATTQRRGERRVGAPALGAPIDRIGRALTGNSLIDTFSDEESAFKRKEEYNRASPADWQSFAADLAINLANYDGFDGQCGNAWLIAAAPGAGRYAALAKLLADDRIWVDSRARVCTHYLAVETGADTRQDCGGRTLGYDVDVFRSRLVNGTDTGVDDGVPRDDHQHSDTAFPFVAAP